MTDTYGWRRCLIAVFLVALAGCTKPGAAPLPAVSPLPNPKVPAWIEQISPTGQADNLAQIRVRFAYPLIPVEAIETQSQQSKLTYFTTTPALAGHFRFLTPRMVGFQADRALPKATRIRVTIRAGLTDLQDNVLASDVSWTFTTQAIELGNLPKITEESSPLSPEPTFEISSNTELDAASLANAGRIVAKDGTSTPVYAKLEKQTTPGPYDDQSYEQFDPSAKPWIYNISLAPPHALKNGERYQLAFSPGVMPAHGNLASTDAFSGTFEVYGPLALVKLGPAGDYTGRFSGPPQQLEFSNPLVADSIGKNITISPAPKGVQVFAGDDGSRFVSIDEAALDPATTYTISIATGLKDTFGQTFGTAKSVTMRTGNLTPAVWAPSGLFIFPADDNLQLDLWAVNVPSKTVEQSFRTLTPAQLVYADPAGDISTLLDDWKTIPAASSPNQSLHFPVPLRAKLGARTGVLAYGIRRPDASSDENGARVEGVVALTNLGIFAQWFPQSGLIQVNHLSDGSPAAGAAVEIWPSRLDDNRNLPVTACATGHTNAAGTATFDAAALAPCMGGKSLFSDAPALLTIAREGSDWAFVRTLDYSGAYDYDMNADWTPDAQSRGTIFPDRMLYQPGETAQFTGEAYYLAAGRLARDAGAPYKIALIDPNGDASSAGTVTTDPYGAFSLQIKFRPNQPLGYYTIEATGRNGVKIDGTFRVAEFKPPNFKVELSTDKQFAHPGESVAASAKSTYLFGAPVQGGKYKFYVTRQQSQFQPPGWDEYSFGRQWLWPEQPPAVSSDVAQADGVLPADGSSNLTFKIGDDLPYPMAYRVDMETTDASNLSVADSKTITALPGDSLIGLTGDFVAQTNVAYPVKVIVTDAQGKAKDGQHIHLELQAVKYSSVTQLVEGSSADRWQVQYSTVAQADVTSGNDAVTASLTPEKSGVYRIRANFAGSNNEATATDLQVWAAGSDIVEWGNENPGRLTVKLDKKTYKPGDTATALIESPYPTGHLYFSVVRYKPIYQRELNVSGGAPRVSFTVTPDMLPNAAVEAVLVRTGVPLSKSVPDSLDSLSRTGFAPLNLALDDKRLKVTIAPAKQTLEPGQSQTVALQMRDALGHPVSGEFAVMVVNEAILQLSGYRPPDLVDTVFAAQPIPTRFADNRPDVVLRPFATPQQKGWGFGGGESQAAAGTRVRTNFQPLAFYKGALLTDASGNSSFTFTLPDDLTTWRVLAVAVSGSSQASNDWKFGGADTTFIASKPLLTNPVLPQFARPGDRFDAGVSVTNTGTLTGQLSIEGVLSGPLAFASSDQRTQTASQTPAAQPGTQAYRFPMIATGLGPTTVRFTTKFGNLSDAFQVPLELRTLPLTESAIESGTTTNSTTIPLNVDQHVDTTLGGLDAELASILLPEFTARAKADLDEDEDLPFLEPIASQLLITANMQILATRYGQIYPDFHPGSAAANDVLRLAKMQLPDGGFPSWPTSKKSDPWITPYAAEALARTKSAGLPVDDAMLGRVRDYMRKMLPAAGSLQYCDAVCVAELRLRLLIGLAALGETRNDYLSDIYGVRDQLDAVDQIDLARYLTEVSGWSAQSSAMMTQIQQWIYETGRNAALNLPPGQRWMSTPTIAQSAALRLFVARNAPMELQDKLVRVIITQRQRGSWPEYYDNAAALTALVDYSRAQPANADFVATLTAGGTQRASEHFQGYRNPLRQVHVPAAQLPKGQSNVVLAKTGAGTLHYVLSYRYRLSGDQPGILNGLRVTRTIGPVNTNTVLRSIGLAVPDGALTLGPAQVFDIGLELITDHPVDHLVITDPLPAGLEAVDTTFKTSTQYFQTHGDSWQIDYQVIYKDRVVAYADHLEAGVYTFHYLVRSVTPGTFAWPGSEVRLQYAPEEFGRTASSSLIVSQ
ncbi:MAG: Ig-like domain-containing protein [Candidatus Eremiobacteraeota bacterium]|nr:Ig-like domain-containing protein [Candidatus Eremiobacteraeota bacterium]